MTFELNTWKSILSESDTQSVNSLRINLEKENERIAGALLDASVHLSKEEAEQQIRFHLAAICGLEEKAKKIAEPAKRIFVEEMLNELLSGLEIALAPCWPKDVLLPGFQWRHLLAETKRQLPQFRSHLVQYGVDMELTKLIMDLLEESLTEKWEMNYHRWYKIRDLLAGLDQVTKASPIFESSFQPDPTDKAIELLMQLNIHNYSIFKYLQDHTTRSVNRRSDPAEQRVFVKALLGYIRNNGDDVPGQSPNTGLRYMYINYLEALVEKMEKPKVVENGAPPVSGLPAGFPPVMPLSEDSMILTNLSSSQLGCMIRLFMDTKVFANHNLKKVAEFMALFVATKKKGAESERSVNNLYANIYTISAGTSDAVEKILHKMLERNAELRDEMATRNVKPTRRQRNP